MRMQVSRHRRAIRPRRITLLRIIVGLIGCLLILDPGCYWPRNRPPRHGDLLADTWVATDGAGRVVPGFEECGPSKKDKWVGIFYWTWHTSGPGRSLSTTRSCSPRPRTHACAWPPPAAYHGASPSSAITRRRIRSSSANTPACWPMRGSTSIFFDTTNPPLTFKDEYEALCREYTAMRNEGARTPAIAFIAPFGDPRPVDRSALARPLRNQGTGRTCGSGGKASRLLLADQRFITRRADAPVLHVSSADARLLARPERAGSVELAGGLSPARLQEPQGRGRSR